MTEQDIREMTVPAALGEVDRIRGFLQDYISGLGLSEEDRFKIELSIYEICVNIALHAYPEGQSGDMAVRIWRDDGSLFIEIRDAGVPFNPVKRKNPDLLLKLRRGIPGGFGVYLFRTLMDGLRYRRVGGQNILTVRKAI